MKRYDAHVNECGCCGPSVEHEESSTGDWVKFEEAAVMVAAGEAHKAHIETLRELRQFDRKEINSLRSKLAKVAELKRQWDEYGWHEDHAEIMRSVCVDLGNVL